MATYVLIHGAGGSDSWYWHLLAPELRTLGHEVVAPDLPIDDDAAGWNEYAAVVDNAIGERGDLIVVAQSMGGFTAPLVAARRPVQLIVLTAAMVPLPGESAGEWLINTGWEQAKQAADELDGRTPTAEFDPLVTFFHDVPEDVTAEAFERGTRNESPTPFQQPWPLTAWPDTPTRFLLCTKDRFFPADFLHKVVRDRLGITPDEIDCGHLSALARPAELAARLEAYRAAAE